MTGKQQSKSLNGQVNGNHQVGQCHAS